MENKRQIIISSILAALLGCAMLYTCLTGGYSIAALITAAALVGLFTFFTMRTVTAADGFFTSPQSLSPDAALGERSLRFARRHPFGSIVIFVLLVRILMVAAAYISYRLTSDVYPGGVLDTLRTVWLRTDSPSYLGISENWYVNTGDPKYHIVFFPLYPIIMMGFNFITGNSFASAMTVSLICSIGSAILLYETAALDMDRAAALRAVKYTFILPAAFFFAAPMSESLFMLAVIACVYLIRRKKYLFGCICGALAGFSRSLGGLLVLFVFAEWLRDVLEDRRLGTLSKKEALLRFLTIFIIPLGLAAYLYINYSVTGSPFTFMRYQHDHWNQGFGFFHESAATQFENLIDSIFEGRWEHVFGLWIPNLAYTFGGLAIVIKGARRLRASYLIFFAAYFLVACGATWLLSSPRYLTACFVLPFALAEICDSKTKDAVATVVSLILMLLYLFMYANGYYVY